MTSLSDPLPRLRQRAWRIRRLAVRMGEVQGQGYVGQALGYADVLAVAYGHAMAFKPGEPEWEGRDRFLLSHGHYAIAHYAALIDAGVIPEGELATYGSDGSRLPMSGMASYTPGMEISGGSLGQGLAIGVGMALGLKHKRNPAFVYNSMSDGELDEGSNWEAVQLAQHLRLSNLVALVDYNKIQSFGTVAEVSELDPLAAKFRAFNWGVHEIDGHDHAALRAALLGPPPLPGRPTVLVLHTVKGKGVSFMEGKLLWHYRNPDAAQLGAALAELGEA